MLALAGFCDRAAREHLDVEMGDSEISAVELEERARKREAIGLSRGRPTAKAVVHSPPEARRNLFGAALGLVAAAAAVAAAVLWLTGFPISAPDGGQTVAPPKAGSLIVRDDFDDPSFALPVGAGEEADLGYVGDLYRIRVERAGAMAWATLGQLNLGGYRFEADLRLASQGDFALGYGGLIARYRNGDNFYLFAVDNDGQYKVELVERGAWRTVQPWTQTAALSEGGRKVLAVLDDGGRLRFAINSVVVYTVADPRLPVGDIGLVAGARSQGQAEGLFDWAAIYKIPMDRQ